MQVPQRRRLLRLRPPRLLLGDFASLALPLGSSSSVPGQLSAGGEAFSSTYFDTLPLGRTGRRCTSRPLGWMDEVSSLLRCASLLGGEDVGGPRIGGRCGDVDSLWWGL